MVPIEKSIEALRADIQAVSSGTFAEVALNVFHYQSRANHIYAQFLDLLRINPADVVQLTDIPFLPIGLFKQFDLQSGDWPADRTFTSSGTTGTTTSRHLLRDPNWYVTNARRTFEAVYGPLTDYTVLALLPAYLERTGSSLVFMANDFIRSSHRKNSGFYLDDLKKLTDVIAQEITAGNKVLLLGVSFALLDLAEHFPGNYGTKLTVMETGGMKGRRRELTRPELHELLQKGLGVSQVHSEYGMTELLSQAYAPQNGRFIPAPTLRAFTREVSDPLVLRSDSKTGALNLIDLANADTISFIATDDLGQVYPDGTFEVLGRMDASDTRGCNLLVG